MAEASQISDQDPDSKDRPNFSITDCSICLEQLRKPKSLPCLHTFCQECLSTFITSHSTLGVTPTFFNCPVCRSKTLPIEPSSTQDIWASHFPTNNFVLEMLKMINPDNTNAHFCELCLKRNNKEIPAVCWCQDCRHFQCENCNQVHNIILSGHKTITVGKLSQRKTAKIPVQFNCEKHGSNNEHICLDHGLLCCKTCIASDHRACRNVTTVKDYAKDLQSKDKLTELVKDIDENIFDIDAFIAECREKLYKLTKDKDTALQRLSDVKNWFYSHISKLSHEVTTKHRVATEKIQITLKDIETVRSYLVGAKTMSDTAQRSGNEHQIVSSVLKGKLEMDKCEQMIQNKHDDDIRIHLNLREELKELIRESKGIGTINAERPFYGRTANLVGSIIVPGDGPYIRGMLVLPNGHLMISDCSGQQLLYATEAGRVLSTLKLNGHPWDICEMPNGEIAVSVYSCMTIAIVRLLSSHLTLVRTIQLTDTPYGIAFYDGFLHVATESKRFLYKLSDNDKLQQIQELDHASYYLACSSSGGPLIGSLHTESHSNSAVYRVSRGNTCSEVATADMVKYATGVDVDDENNIYVCGLESNNVLQISADGSRTRDILKCGAVSPFVIKVHGDKLYICEHCARTVKIYRLE